MKRKPLYIPIFEGNYPRKVDREKGIVQGAKLLGPRGKINPYVYTQRSLDSLAKIYEGHVCKWDHLYPHSKGTSRASFCVIRNTRSTPEGIYGDLHLFHPQGDEEQRFLGICEQNAKGVGFSHNVDVADEYMKPSGKKIVVDILDPNKVILNSVDLVENPSTVNSIFEQSGGNMVPGYTQIFEQEDAPADGYALLSQAMAAFQSAGDTDMATKIHKLLKPAAKEETPAAPEAPGEEKPVMEQGQKPAGYTTITEQTLDLLSKTMGVKLGAELREVVLGLPVDKAVRILESQKPAQSARNPINQPRAPQGTPAVPTKKEELAARYAV